MKDPNTINWDEKALKDIFNLIRRGGTQSISAVTERLVTKFKEHYHIYTLRETKSIEMWIYDNGIFVPEAQTYIQQFVRVTLEYAHTAQITNAVIVKLQADTYISNEEMFREEHVNLIPVLNGVLNLKTRKLLPFDPKYKFFNKINAKYDINAKCPNFEKHLHTILDTKKDFNTIQELFGFSLYRIYKFEKGFILIGFGRNGKTKTLEILKHFLTVSNCCNISIQSMKESSFVISELHKKLANICGDMGKSKLTETQVYKQLTGGEMVQAHRKFLTDIKFKNYAKMIFAANEIPESDDNSSGFWSRWVKVEFNVSFKSKTEYNSFTKEEREKQKIKLINAEIVDNILTPEEMSGILNFSLDGLDRLLKNKTFSNEETAEEIKKFWARKSSTVFAFIEDHVVGSFHDNIPKEDFRNEYKKYCFEHELKMGTDAQIRHYLTTILGASEKQESDTKQRLWTNICWKKDKKKPINVDFSDMTQDEIVGTFDNNTTDFD